MNQINNGGTTGSTTEKITRFVIEHFFKARFWVLVGGGVGVYFVAKYVSEDPLASKKDIIQVITGCTLMIALFYTIITYEYNQRKFKYDVKNAKDITSFNVSTEWYKEPLAKHSRICMEFLIECREMVDEVNANKFHDTIENPDNTEKKMALMAVFNYFESISLGVKQGIMDEDFIKGFFHSVFEHYYNEYSFYIEHRRKVKKNHRIWRNFTDLAKKWIES